MRVFRLHRPRPQAANRCAVPCKSLLSSSPAATCGSNPSRRRMPRRWRCRAVTCRTLAIARPTARPDPQDGFRAWFERVIQQHGHGSLLGFAIIDLQQNVEWVGGTTSTWIFPGGGSATSKIGNTWIARSRYGARRSTPSASCCCCATPSRRSARIACS